MKKSILAMAAVLAMSVVSVPAFAQNTANGNKACTEQCAKKDGCKKQCDKPGECSKQKCGKAGKAACPFEGLNLTDAQKQKLQAIQKPAKRMGEYDKAQRAERAKQVKAARQSYLNEVKAVLTPEQYVQFLENNFLNPAPKHAKNKQQGMKAGKGPKQGNGKARPAGPSINARGKKSAD